jgi:probable rRNA maturation factor
MLPDTRPATLAVRFVDAEEGRSLNRTYRGKDYATNVLTFPYDKHASPGAPIEADIVICMPVLEAEALAQKKPLSAHVAHLVVHGVLHAAGYDHDAALDAEAMEQLERDVLARFRIADPYRDDLRV